MSFFGFLGGLLKGGLSIATHGLINVGGAGSSGGGVPSAGALPGVGMMGFGGGMPTFSPGRGFSLTGPSPTGPGGGSRFLPHMACGLSDTGKHTHRKKPHTKAERHTWFALPCVTNRRMNVANPRALRRSIRRLYGAEKMYARLLRVTHPHKRGRVHPKPPRRRKS